MTKAAPSAQSRRTACNAQPLPIPAIRRKRFAAQVVHWQRKHGRHGLPWQKGRDPYAIWLSEVMLQQTQVSAVIPYYERFLARFPDCAALAAAPLDDVMRLWSGLGYYSRARNLHRAARIIAESHGGEFPRTLHAIAELPGVGRSTAAAIAAFAFGLPAAILDGNVKRVLSRAFGIEGDPASAAYERSLWSLAESLLPGTNVQAYTQGLMDLGATVCLRRGAKCIQCPLVRECVAYHTGRIDELPAARVRKVLPQRDTAMLLICYKGEVLLEKRPPVGIWGALWSLPEAATEEDPRALCRERFGVRCATFTKLPIVTHGFTHYSLRIHPLRVDVQSINPSVREPGFVWITLDDALGAALPVPVKRMLRAL